MTRGSDRRFRRSSHAARLHYNAAERLINVGTRMTLLSRPLIIIIIIIIIILLAVPARDTRAPPNSPFSFPHTPNKPPQLHLDSQPTALWTT